jgi:hypothetical protein
VYHAPEQPSHALPCLALPCNPSIPSHLLICTGITIEAQRASDVGVRAFGKNGNTKDLSHLRFCVSLPGPRKRRKIGLSTVTWKKNGKMENEVVA